MELHGVTWSSGILLSAEIQNYDLGHNILLFWFNHINHINHINHTLINHIQSH
jgi:hypothetical protein